MSKRHFQIFVDTGGTFTDCIAVDESGRQYHRKVLSSSCLRGTIVNCLSPGHFTIKESWNLKHDILKGFYFRFLDGSIPDVKIESYNWIKKEIKLTSSLDIKGECAGLNFEVTSGEEAPVLGIRLITQTGLGDNFPSLSLKLGSTKGTNALLEKKGAKTLHIVTKGFADLLSIGNQSRPDIFSLKIQKPRPLARYIIEAEERIGATGEILTPLDTDALRKKMRKIDEDAIESVSVSLINAYKNPTHEIMIRDFLKELGFRFVSISTELSPLIKILNRAETTVVNAYLLPIIHNYVNGITSQLGQKRFQIMTSAGGLVSSDHFHPKDSLLSGPAGGVVGAAKVGIKSGYKKLITFDMGGTSTDVSRIDGAYDYKYELEIDDAKVYSPAIAIETVAAGGGSICGFDGFKMFVGPESAGAFPGPACYGAGGPLTITDVNLLLNRLDAGQFGIPVFKDHAEERLNELMRQLKKITGTVPSRLSLLNGFINIANEIMAKAIRKISISKGYDPRDFALMAFGGAGGIHACDIAENLGIEKVLMPENAGLLSAYGIGNADVERFAERQVLMDLEKIKADIDNWIYEIGQEAIHKLTGEGYTVDKVKIRSKLLFLRYKGQDTNLEIPFYCADDIVPSFRSKYEKIYGHKISNREIEVEAIRVIAYVSSAAEEKYAVEVDKRECSPSHTLDNDIHVFIRQYLTPGAFFSGPGILADDFSTTFIKPGWRAEIDSTGTAILSRYSKPSAVEWDQIRETELELYTNRFMSIAENMGALLQRTALSVNIKERLDFSCALLDNDGRLVANAPHIPVHLGGLGVCVRSLLKEYSFEEGDTLVTNHPKFGGSHLPDVTMVTPVFNKGKRIGFVVNRAHHAEIGGISPGSMPPDAKNLEEEGVVIFPFFLVRKGKANWKGMKKILLNSRYPSRSIEENLADLNAALAANKKGEEELLDLIAGQGIEKVQNYLLLLRNHASEKISQTLKGFHDGEYSACEYLDDGSALKVNIRINDGHCRIDFTGSAPVHPGNMNATEAIVKSVAIYVLRLLLNEPIPLNDGLLKPVAFVLPEGLLNPEFDSDPSRCPAVVGGNVEISQRLTDTLLKAFGIAAASQGTMNNTLFGNKRFGYYETVCGGCGAVEGYEGASAVHQHMTNTRITDPEIMEHRYPVRITEFSIRKNSGGKGKWRGGDGARRVIEFLENVNLSVLTQRRNSGPYGCKGGMPGMPGHQEIIRDNGETVFLNSIQNINMNKGDILVMETPGGGGYGKK